MKKITAKIDKKTGKLSIETSGYTGEDCYKATEQLEKSLGMDRACSTPTAEYFAPTVENEQKVGE